MSDSVSALLPVIGAVCGGALALLVFSVAFWTARDAAARTRDRALRHQTSPNSSGPRSAPRAQRSAMSQRHSSPIARAGAPPTGWWCA